MRKLTASAIVIAVLAVGLTLLGHATAAVSDEASVTTTSLVTYDAGAAGFGPSTFDLTGAAEESANDACTTPPNVTGAIAVVDVGGPCTVIDKASNAEAGGAVAIVIVNSLNSALHLGGSGSVTIPAVGISSSDGTALKNDISNGPVSARLRRTDTDGDFVQDAADNCPIDHNPSQTNTDGDAAGDACDADIDNDSVSNPGDNCPLVANVDQTNSDADTQGDACDADDDNDAFDDSFDRCDRATDSTDGCPDHTRTATKPTYDKTTFTFAGTFEGTHDLCDTGFVYLYKEKKGADLLMGQTKTGDGTYDIPLAAKAKRGKYYAFVDTFTSDDDGECLAISSPIKRIK